MRGLESPAAEAMSPYVDDPAGRDRRDERAHRLDLFVGDRGHR